MANLPTTPNQIKVTEEKANVTGHSDRYSFCSESKYGYNFAEKNNCYFSEPLDDSLSTDKHSHHSSEDISNSLK